MLDPVEIWISKMEKRYSGSPSTESRYRTQLQQFCDFVGTTPQEIVVEWKNVRQTGQLIDRENYVEEMLDKIDAYEHHLGKQDLTKSSIFTYLVSVASFFKYLRIPVKLEFGNRRVVYHNRDITVEEIRRILSNSTPRDTAFYLMMVQSGLRPVTLMQLTYAQVKKDFEANRIPCHIDVPRSMTKGEYKEHFTFIGPDAVNALKAYFKDRGVPKDNETIFTGVKTASAFSMRFGYYVRNLGLIKPEDMREGRKPQQLRLYCLRKFFRNIAGPAGIDYVNFWMGHKQPGVDDHYFTTDVKKHRERYEKFAMPNLQIFEPSALDVSAQLRELDEKLRAKDNIIAELTTRLNEVLGTADEIIRINERMSELKEREIETEIKTIEARIKIMKRGTPSEFEIKMIKENEELLKRNREILEELRSLRRGRKRQSQSSS